MMMAGSQHQAAMGLPLAAHRVAVEAAERLVLPAAWARADLAAAEVRPL